jgi:SNF family Na+-dependent transporter
MVSDKVSIHGAWASRWVFILAATGSAVGLGNIWKFPYMTGMYGGGAFVIMYLLCIFLVGLPIMLAETLIGRRGRQSPVNALGALMGMVAGWVLRREVVREELAIDSPLLFGVVYWLVRVVAPLGILIVFVAELTK